MSAGGEFGSCPVPHPSPQRIQMAHGGGGKWMHQLIDQMFLTAFEDGPAAERHDSAVLNWPRGRLAFTTDSYVVRPIIFPGGDIGSLAVHGTVNDLAMSGARAAYLSAGFVLEEGLSLDTLRRVVHSMRDAARRCGVRIVTGDTKVVDSGDGGGLFINTAGIGIVDHSLAIAPAAVQPGDAVLVNGDLGRHGMSIMSVRKGLEFESTIESDSAPLGDLVAKLIESGVAVHCLRDVTRGGLASTLNEIAAAAELRIVIDEKSVPVREDVRAACEILGLDPLHVACEGRMVAFVAPDDAERALRIMRAHESGSESVQIGSVQAGTPPLVILKGALGTKRILDMPTGEQLPRIC